MPVTGITRPTIEHWSRRELGRRSNFKPSVWLLSGPRGSFVLKEARTAPWITRWLARWLLKREREVLRVIDGLDGVPRVLSILDADAFVSETLPGEPLHRHAFQACAREIADQLNTILRGLHARGVYHLDLHNKRNLLLDGHRVNLVDFGAAVRPGPLGRLLFGRILAWIDRQATVKFLARWAPEALTEAEAKMVCQRHRLRRFWIFTGTCTRGEYAAAQTRLRELAAEPVPVRHRCAQPAIPAQRPGMVSRIRT